jgi:hypothetical protein
VTVGTPVVTADDEKIGSVKEVRPNAFKVDTGLFHRDMWLPAYTVAEAVPEQVVTLTVEKARLPEHKLEGEPEEAA